MSDACLLTQKEGLVLMQRVPHQEAMMILRSEDSADRRYRMSDTVCEWSEARSAVDDSVVGIILRDPYDDVGRSILVGLNGRNVSRRDEVVCILEEAGSDWVDSVGPYLPVYALQEIWSGQMSLLVLEYYS